MTDHRITWFGVERPVEGTVFVKPPERSPFPEVNEACDRAVEVVQGALLGSAGEGVLADATAAVWALLAKPEVLRALADLTTARVRGNESDRDEGARRWNEAVAVLLNSRHTADPDVQGPFWDAVEGRITTAQLRALFM